MSGADRTSFTPGGTQRMPAGPKTKEQHPASIDHLARQRLHRMKWLATGLLVGMALLFVVAHVNLARHPAWGYVAAFAEAAMVGALADWFAVVALFRHPLGLPFWHTAIIPNSKDEIARNLGHFVEEHFASLDVIVARVRALDPAAKLTQWLLLERNARQIGDLLASAVRHALASVDDQHLREQLRLALTTRLGGIDLEKPVAEFGFSLLADQKHEELLDWALRSTQAWLDTEAADATLAAALDKVMDNKLLALFKGTAATRIRAGLKDLLAAVDRDPAHPVRRRYTEHLRGYLVDLKTNPAAVGKLRQFQLDTLNDTRIQSGFASLWDEVRNWLNEDLNQSDPQLGQHAARMARQWGLKLATDPRTRTWINESLVDYLTPLIAENRGRVAAFIQAQIDAWSKEEMTQRIELAVGRDLQFIRINGTVVGGVAGLVIYVAVKLAST